MAFSVKQTFKSTMAWLGQSEDCLPAVMLTCLADALIKPSITLNNPNKPWDERYYAAKREVIHHLNALPVVTVFSWVFAKVGGILMKPAFRHLPQVSGNASVKLLQDTAFSSLGIIAANFAIPVIDNLIIHPIERVLDPFAQRYVRPLFDKPQTAVSDQSLDKSQPTESHKPLISFAASQATLRNQPPAMPAPPAVANAAVAQVAPSFSAMSDSLTSFTAMNSRPGIRPPGLYPLGVSPLGVSSMSAPPMGAIAR